MSKKKLTSINANAVKLRDELDTNVRDRTITFVEWRAHKEKNSTEGEWSDFKTEFIKTQKDLGYLWEKKQGFAGPITLQKIKLDSVCGQELADFAFKQGIKEGHFVNDVLKIALENVFDYLGSDYNDILDYSEAKEGFKEYKTGSNESYRCSGQGGMSFVLKTRNYEFNASPESKKREFEFGELLAGSPISQSFFLDNLGLTNFKHIQTSRQFGKYLNADFQGFRINRSIDEDHFDMFNFELKPSNNIDHISTAISQAINYKNKANFTYVIIPMFDYENFYDLDRFGNFIELCKGNHIGIISVRMDHKEHKILDVVEVVRAEKTELLDSSDLHEMLVSYGYEKCPLCRKIVSTEHRSMCGWEVEKSSDGKSTMKCMKQLMEENMVK